MLYQCSLTSHFIVLCFLDIFSAWSAYAGSANQDGASRPLGDTLQPWGSWRIPLNPRCVLPDDLIGGFLLHPGLRMLACDGCCLCQIMVFLASVQSPQPSRMLGFSMLLQ